MNKEILNKKKNYISNILRSTQKQLIQIPPLAIIEIPKADVNFSGFILHVE